MVVRSLTAAALRSPSSPSTAPEGANDKTPNSVEAASIAASRVRGKREESLASILKPPLDRRMRRKAATFLRCSAFSSNGQHATPPACRSPDRKPRRVSTSERMDTKKALEKKSPQLALRAGFRSAGCYRSIIVLIAAIAVARDLPDCSGTRDLYQRQIPTFRGTNDNARIRIGTARIAHRAVVHQVGGAVRPEADGGRAIDATHLADKRLLGFARTFRRAVRVMALIALPAIEGEARKLQLARIGLAGEVDQLDVMAGFGRAVCLREAEIAFARHQHRILLHHAMHERIRHEVEADCRHVRRLEGQRRHRLLREKGEHRANRFVLYQALLVRV